MGADQEKEEVFDKMKISFLNQRVVEEHMLGIVVYFLLHSRLQALMRSVPSTL